MGVSLLCILICMNESGLHLDALLILTPSPLSSGVLSARTLPQLYFQSPPPPTSTELCSRCKSRPNGGRSGRGGRQAESFRPGACISLPPTPPPPHSTPPKAGWAGTPVPRPQESPQSSTQELRAVHIRLDPGLLTTAHPYHKLHTSHSLQGHTPSTPPSSHTTSLTPPHTQPSVPTLTTNSLTVDNCPEPPAPSPSTRSYLRAGSPSAAPLLAVLRVPLIQTRGLGDTSLRYEELGGGWVPSPERAEVAPALCRPLPALSGPARQGSRCSAQAGS